MVRKFLATDIAKLIGLSQKLLRSRTTFLNASRPVVLSLFDPKGPLCQSPFYLS